MRYILFDIDGTLIDSGGAGVRSLNLAFREYLGIDRAFDGISMAGKTDIQILREGLGKFALSSENGAIDSLIALYLKYLGTEVNNLSRHMKPGVYALLEALGKKKDVYLGLLTGNIEAGARIKLSPFELNGFFPIGAFGSDHEDRNMLLPHAVERFSKLYGKSVDYKDCTVIGDTPLDVLCSKPYGARAIAVATGTYAFEHLKKTDADMVLYDLSNIDAIVEYLTAPYLLSNSSAFLTIFSTVKPKFS